MKIVGHPWTTLCRGDTVTPACSPPAHGARSFQLLDREPLLDDQGALSRRRPAHGDVVHGAVDGQLAMFPAEEDGSTCRSRGEAQPQACSSKMARRSARKNRC